jgi:hypothetical protein
MKSIKNLEMQNHISELISIDSFQAKLGNDEDVTVVKFQTDNKQVAEDLVHYVETGCKFVLDADNSPSKNQEGRYDIFVEIERNDILPQRIMELVRDIEKVSGMIPWRFTFHKKDSQYSLSEENLATIVPTSASQYTFLTDDNVEEDIKSFFESAPLRHKRIKGKRLTLKKAFTNHEMIIEAFNQNVEGTYKIDRESNEQASYLNHWLGGGYSVVKVDDLFKITKGKKSILAKVKEL